MFLIDPQAKHLDLTNNPLQTLIQSINQPLVAAGEHPSEETIAFVVTLRFPREVLQTYIYLYLVQSNDCLIFYFDEGPYLMDRRIEAETEALDFVESMGFIMDDLRYLNVSPREQKEMHQTLPIFFPELQRFRSSGQNPKSELNDQAEFEEDVAPLSQKVPAQDAPENESMPPWEEQLSAPADDVWEPEDDAEVLNVEEYFTDQQPQEVSAKVEDLPEVVGESFTQIFKEPAQTKNVTSPKATAPPPPSPPQTPASPVKSKRKLKQAPIPESRDIDIHQMIDDLRVQIRLEYQQQLADQQRSNLQALLKLLIRL